MARRLPTCCSNCKRAKPVLQLPPLSLYVHIPWCLRKCPYCDFNSHQAAEEIPERAYVDALIDDLKADLSWVQGRKLHSIFFGGGTPSLFSGRAIGEILTAGVAVLKYFSNASKLASKRILKSLWKPIQAHLNSKNFQTFAALGSIDYL